MNSVYPPWLCFYGRNVEVAPTAHFTIAAGSSDLPVANMPICIPLFIGYYF